MKTPILDSNENFWSLACILGVIGIPGMVIGSQLAQSYGIMPAILSIFSGNLILWILGLGIISMAGKKSHAIDNIKKHFGKWSSLLATFLLTLAFLRWYTFQLANTTSLMTSLFHFQEEWKIGVFLGFFVSILALGGFKIVKWTCLISLPILAITTLYYMFTHQVVTEPISPLPFSYLSILPILLAFLSGTVNLPTFFRHSKSRTDSIVAMSLIMIIHTLFQIASVFYGRGAFSTNNEFSSLIMISCFSILSFSCVNLTNIYFVSACWEMIFPHDYGAKKYLIFGIFGTFAYLGIKFIENTNYFFIIEPAINYSMITLLLSLLINFLISIAVKHRLLYLSKFLGSMSWLIGCTVTIISLVHNPQDPNRALMFGCISTILFSIITVFLEESIWAIKTIREEKHR